MNQALIIRGLILAGRCSRQQGLVERGLVSRGVAGPLPYEFSSISLQSR